MHQTRRLPGAFDPALDFEQTFRESRNLLLALV
jgi:hypothetical protein